MKPTDASSLVVAAGDPGRVKQISEMFDEAKLVNDNRGLLAYTGLYNGKRVTTVTHGMGGPSSAIVFEELLMLGAKKVIRLGTTAALVPGLNIGDLVVPTGAAYNDGSLKMYVPDGVLPAVPDLDLTNRLIARCRSLNVKHKAGLVFSSDAFYGEDTAFISKWTSRGVISVEMECATLFSLGLIKRFSASALLVVSDNLIEESQSVMVPKTKIKEPVDQAARIALDTLTDAS